MISICEYDVEDDSEIIPIPEFVAPIAMDLIKDQHVRLLHPKHWLAAARNLRGSAEVIIAHERPFEEVARGISTGEFDGSHFTRHPNFVGAQLLYAFAFENLLKGIIIAKNPEIRNPDMWGVTEEEEEILKERRKKEHPR
jgi:hypothetical protein